MKNEIIDKQCYYLGWGILFHLLDLKDKFENNFIEFNKWLKDNIQNNLSSPYIGLKNSLELYHDILINKKKYSQDEIFDKQYFKVDPDSESFLLLNEEEREEYYKKKDKGKFNRSILRRIQMVKSVGEIQKLLKPVDSFLPSLAKESIDKDSFNNGFSRHPFDSIDLENTDHLALASICYLLRAHCMFFCRPKQQREFNAAKISLNDIHQAYQLAWRLYHSLPNNHHNQMQHGLDKYLDNLLGYNGTAENPGKSTYYIYNLLLLCEIFRGNIYKEIAYLHGADRHYRHAEERFELVCEYRNKVKSEKTEVHKIEDSEVHFFSWFTTPTVIRCLFERSIVQFENGHFIESLLTQIRCIEFIIKRDILNNNNSKIVIDKIEIVRKFLNSERSLSLYDRKKISRFFGEIQKEGGETNNIYFDPTEIINVIPKELAGLTNAIMTRIGFTLYTLRPHSIALRKHTVDEEVKYNQDREILSRWLSPFFRWDKLWNKNNEPQDHIVPSSHGIYGETILNSSDDNNKFEIGDIFNEEVDRRFTLLLRQHNWKNRFKEGAEIDEVGFYKAILTTVTENITNLITIPRRNQQILMRRGYKFRASNFLGESVYDNLLTSLKYKSKEGTSNDNKNNRPLDRLVILRRWQSYNPKIPRPESKRLRGGGYFLFWHNKGIVIDPGFDFILNFYDEGFSLEDIDAICITHSHPDHDDDFATLTTLIKEWNEFYEATGDQNQIKKIDLFLNESAHTKFSAWLHASSVKIGRLIPLSSMRWERESETPDKGTLYLQKEFIDLRTKDTEGKLISPDGYDMMIEVVPAWHHDVINRTAAVGLKFHLYNDDGKKTGIIGYTSDSRAYGHNIDEKESSNTQHKYNEQITRQYNECDILIAHLGDIKIRELASAMKTVDEPWHDNSPDDAGPSNSNHDKNNQNKSYKIYPLLSLLRTWFTVPSISLDKNKQNKKTISSKIFKDKLRDYINFVITLDLIPADALKIKITCNDNDNSKIKMGVKQWPIQDWLGSYLTEDWDTISHDHELSLGQAGTLIQAFQQFKDSVKIPIDTSLEREIEKQLQVAVKNTTDLNLEYVRDEWAYLLLEFITICSLTSYQYAYHLGIYGIYNLFKSMVDERKKSKKTNLPLFIVGEFPEELTSYRHRVAHWLNLVKDNLVAEDTISKNTAEPDNKHTTTTTLINDNSKKESKKYVYAFTGDIGLHIGLEEEYSIINPKVRCTYCNYNNETVIERKNYHSPAGIFETPIKRLDASMIYLCTQFGHHPNKPDYLEYFLSRPELHVI